MNMARLAAIAASAALLTFSQVGAAHAQADAGSNRVMLFDGQSLNGWRFAIQGRGLVDIAEQDLIGVTDDGVLHFYAGKQNGAEAPMALLFTENSYSRYRVHVEYRWGTAKFPPRMESVRDSGLLFHIAGPAVTDDGREEWVWPVAAESQIQETDTGDLWLILTRGATTLHDQDMVFSPRGPKRYRGYFPNDGRGYDSSKHARENEVDGWNTVELVVDGDSAQFFVNGELLNGVSELQRMNDAGTGWMPLESGAIGLQLEAAEIFYRNIWLAPLAETPDQ